MDACLEHKFNYLRRQDKSMEKIVKKIGGNVYRAFNV
jgi:hypothetical protein